MVILARAKRTELSFRVRKNASLAYSLYNWCKIMIILSRIALRWYPTESREREDQPLPLRRTNHVRSQGPCCFASQRGHACGGAVR